MLLGPLATVTGVVERRQTLPILANVFMRMEENQLTLVGTDLEVEISIEIGTLSGEDGECTVTARKLLDICRALPETATIDFSGEGDKVKMRSGRSRFTLQALPSKDFPRLEAGNWEERFKMPQPELRNLFDRTAFSMAQQDVRYFLNGVLIELDGKTITTVATDGHRLARSQTALSSPASAQRQAIVPRKAVAELGRFLGEGADDDVTGLLNILKFAHFFLQIFGIHPGTPCPELFSQVYLLLDKTIVQSFYFKMLATHSNGSRGNNNDLFFLL